MWVWKGKIVLKLLQNSYSNIIYQSINIISLILICISNSVHWCTPTTHYPDICSRYQDTYWMRWDILYPLLSHLNREEKKKSPTLK